MELATLVWILPLIVLAYVLVFAQYLKRQDRPPPDKHGQTPAE